MLNALDAQLGNSERKNRNRLEIVRDVLVVVAVKVRKTRIMYQANLSHPLTEKYLNSLLLNGLVERDDGFCYLITSKGKEFLQMYAEFLDRHRRIREEINGAGRDKLLLESMVFQNSNSKQVEKVSFSKSRS